MNLPIRTRLTLSFCGLFLGLILIFSSGLYFSLSGSLARDFELEMVHDGKLVAEIFKEEMKLNALVEFVKEVDEFGMELMVLDGNRELVVQSIGWREKGMVLPHDVFDGTSSFPRFWENSIEGVPHKIFAEEVFIEDEGAFTIFTVRPLTSLLEIQRRLQLFFLIWIPVVLVLGSGVGFFFANRALSPVESLRQMADSISTKDLSVRLPYPPVKDELYSLTETLNKSLDRIEEGFGKLRRFTADASHELRIPLTALRGTLEVALRKDRGAEEYKEAIHDALEEAEMLSGLAQDLLMLARMDSKQWELNFSDVDLKPFLEGVLREGQILGENKKINFTLKSLPESNVKADPDRLRQVFLNLMDNAVKYNRERGEVILDARLSGKDVVISVQDKGEGISPENQEKIFDRFFRVDKSRSRQTGGTGLGLAICKGIVEAHGGRLTLVSEPGKGSIFSVILPLA